MNPMLSNGSRGTLMSHTDHSVQRHLKSNASTIMLLSDAKLCMAYRAKTDNMVSKTQVS